MNLDNKSDIIHENIKSLSWGDKINLAQNPNTPATTLEQLATDEDWMVRWDIAENPNTPRYIKKYLKIQKYLAIL
jgi:hypothetical protein